MSPDTSRFFPASGPFGNAVRLLVYALVPAFLAAAGAAPLGSGQFAPSPESPLGWRGDGTGRFPGATGPTAWERKAGPDGYTTKGIVWMTPLPNNGVSSPIVVGDRIFLTAEVQDLICLDKKTGRIIWLRSAPEFEGLSEEERKANPAYAEKLTPLLADLDKANADAVTALNAALPTAMTSAPHALDPVLKRKRDLEKQIQDAQLAIDKKKFNHDWRQVVFGFSGPTPTSDGKHVFVFYTTGVVACYDLDGHRKWINRGGTDMSEHGNFASPLLGGYRLVVWANEMRAYEADSGRLAWTAPAKAFNTYGSLFRVQSGKELVACFQWGFFTRIRDGQAIWDAGSFGDSVSTPIVEGDTIFAHVGYPRANDETKGMRSFKIPASTDGGKLAADLKFKTEWAEDELTVDKKKNPFDRGYVASPLYVDGLLYQVTQGAGL
ncbi:MAG TPA: PQQ-binding-like beta-propeller repeat protein, partial [Chthoniobacteraceae bacterium]|nr:PQQ-binding-like beta-propeller repeat protein [Chthoniobacteraceae bacterium]